MDDPEPDCRLDTNAHFKVFRFGPDQEPLIVIDDALVNPSALVEYAARDDGWGPAGAAYPGIRRPAPNGYLRSVFDALRHILGPTFGFSDRDRFRLQSSYSMITHMPEELRHNQRVPHIDRTGPTDLAMVHYLCAAHHGGTSFFRHASTGFQRLTDDNAAAYNSSLQQEMNRQILPNGFPDAEHPLFEHLLTAEARFNRLIIYRASVLHSPGVDRATRFSADPRTGRLTMTSFLFAEDQAS